MIRDLDYRIYEVLDLYGFNTTEIELENEEFNEYSVELYQYTPDGENWSFAIWFDGTDKGFVDAVYKFYNSWMLDEETEDEEFGPLSKEMEWKDNILFSLSDKLENISFDC